MPLIVNRSPGRRSAPRSHSGARNEASRAANALAFSPIASTTSTGICSL